MGMSRCATTRRDDTRAHRRSARLMRATLAPRASRRSPLAAVASSLHRHPRRSASRSRGPTSTLSLASHASSNDHATTSDGADGGDDGARTDDHDDGERPTASDGGRQRPDDGSRAMAARRVLAATVETFACFFARQRATTFLLARSC